MSTPVSLFPITYFTIVGAIYIYMYNIYIIHYIFILYIMFIISAWRPCSLVGYYTSFPKLTFSDFTSVA